MAAKECFDFPSVKGVPLQARRWIPDGKIRGIIQIVHGMAEHIDRYDHVACALNDAGFLVTGHNHLGHGQSSSLHGFFGAQNGWQALIDDVHSLRTITEKAYPDIPYFLLGHSMGSFVVRCYLTEHADGLAGAVISGTGYYQPPVVRAGLALSNLLCSLGYAKKESPIIDRIAFSSSNKPFAPNRTPFDWLTRDKTEVDKYISDPECGFLFTASGYRDLFRGLMRLTRTEDLKRIPSSLPVLFISGERDPIGAMGNGVRKVSQDFINAKIRNITVHLYPECRHELFNELNRQEVFGDLIDWLEKQLSD
jgi:alpha-beta hydrolase superfamily lysophospholipase